MRIRISRIGVAAVAALLCASSLVAGDGDHDRRDKARFAVSAELIGYQEVPALSTTARGRFFAWVDTKANTISYRLKYDTLEGEVTQAHVHFGQRGVNGGISFFLCSNLGNGPAGTPPCPAPPADVSGTINADLVIGPTATGIEPGAFAEIAAAIREGVAYANVHTTKWPAGEIRGQLH